MFREMLVPCCLVAAVVLCWSLPVRAQQRPVSFGAGGLVGLAQDQAVQKELGIEKDEAKLAEIRKLSGAIVRDMDEAYRSAGSPDRAELQTTFQKIRARYEPDLQKLLTPEQLTRLKQISWQGGGPAALTDPEVVQALNITAEQTKKLVALNREYTDKQRQLIRERGLGSAADQEFNKKVQEQNAERDKRVEQILSKSQQDKLAELKGLPFDFKRKPRPSAGPGGLIGIARMERVQKEIGIENDATKIEEIHKLAERTMREMREQFRNATGDQRERVDVRSRNESDLKSLLTDEQFTRLKQIHWQTLGARAFDDPEVVKAVDISEQQSEKLAAINHNFNEELKEDYSQIRQSKLTIAEHQKKMQDMSAKRDQEIDQLLSETQKEKFTELKGQPFSLTKPAESK